MNIINFVLSRVTALPRPKWLIDWSFSFLYWMVFLLVLEPGNLYRAFQLGQTLSFIHEATRIFVATLLGTLCTPVIRSMALRMPPLAPFNWPYLTLYVGSILGLAFGLILLSCFLAAWLFEHQWAPKLVDIQKELIGNYLLVVYAVLGYAAIVQLKNFMRRSVPQKVANETLPLSRIEVKSRGKLMFVDISDIDWIETQGNYLALHVGTEVHLIRETLVKLTAQLEANRFIQIHRRVVVAVNRIKNIQPLTNGDSALL